jgi:catechol 2,3-dioxygenase-like lactoylglutathione lyase family enzyme
MLAGTRAVATVAVRDVEAARRFYEETLGLTPAQSNEPPGVTTYTARDSFLLVYESAYAGTNRATSVTWGAGDDFEQLVAGLRERGVTFEHYDDLPGTTREGDIHHYGDLRAAWFKDPDGNIHNLVNQRA